MKKHLLVLQVFCMLSMCKALSQNYHFFPKNQKAYFLDTTRALGFGEENYLFYFPQAQFKSENAVKDSVFNLFGDNVDGNLIPFGCYIKMQNGNQKIYLNYLEDTLLILQNAQPGDSWNGLIDYNGNTQPITYVEKIFASVCGVDDSLKVYSLNGKTIKVSKHFGLVEIPVGSRISYNDMASECHLKLLFLEQYKPQFKFSDLRNVVWFNEGYIYGGTNSVAYNMVKDYVRFEIISKTVKPDSITYEVAFWDDQQSYTNGNSPQIVGRYRDTADLVVKSDRIYSANSRIESYLKPHVSFSENNFGYIKFLPQDTIVSIGWYVSFEGPTNIVSISFEKGYIHKLEQFGSPMPLTIINLDLHCYYEKGFATNDCQRVEELTPIAETSMDQDNLICTFDPVTREIKIFWKDGGHTPTIISVVDVQGRTMIRSEISSETRISTSTIADGYYQVLIDTEKGKFRKSVSVYQTY